MASNEPNTRAASAVDDGKSTCPFYLNGQPPAQLHVSPLDKVCTCTCSMHVPSNTWTACAEHGCVNITAQVHLLHIPSNMCHFFHFAVSITLVASAKYPATSYQPNTKIQAPPSTPPSTPKHLKPSDDTSLSSTLAATAASTTCCGPSVAGT